MHLLSHAGGWMQEALLAEEAKQQEAQKAKEERKAAKARQRGEQDSTLLLRSRAPHLPCAVPATIGKLSTIKVLPVHVIGVTRSCLKYTQGMQDTMSVRFSAAYALGICPWTVSMIKSPICSDSQTQVMVFLM